MRSSNADAFIGRDIEMQTLRTGVEKAIQGRGNIQTIAGEPGIGKTRLAMEVSDFARQLGVKTYLGSCWEAEGAPQFWPWIQILRQHPLFDDIANELEHSPTKQHDLSLVLPELQSPNTSRGAAVESDLDNGQTRFRVFDTIAQTLDTVSREQPILLVLDDLHCADQLSLRFLRFLGTTVEHTKIAILATYRDNEVKRNHSLSLTLSEIARLPTARTVPLYGLSEDEVRSLVAFTLPNDTADFSLAQALFERTEGNPFFLRETIQLLAHNHPHLSADVHCDIPDTVREAIAQRIESLSPDCIDTLSIASVIGRDFSSNLVTTASKLKPSSALQALRESMGAGILTPLRGKPEHYRFSHVLIRDWLYDAMTISARASLHTTVAEAMEAKHPNNPSTLGALAHHFSLGTLDGDRRKAIDYRERAGRYALDSLAYEDAAVHYRSALKLISSESDSQQRAELLLGLSEALNKSGSMDAARDVAVEAAELARRIGNRELIGLAALAYGWEIRTGLNDEVLIELLEDALDRVGTDHGALKARILSRLARALYWTSRRDQGQELSQAALDLARGTGDAVARAQALATRWAMLWSLSHSEERTALVQEMRALGLNSGDWELRVVGERFRAVNELESGNRAGVDAAVEAHANLTNEWRQPLYRNESDLLHAMHARLVGDLDRAEEILAGLDHRFLASFNLLHLAVVRTFLALDRGNYVTVIDELRQITEAYPSMPSWRCVLAQAYCHVESFDLARREFTCIAKDDFAIIPRDGLWSSAATTLSTVSAVLNARPEAERLYVHLSPFAGRNTCVGYAGAFTGPVDYYLGILATTCSRWEEAQRHFECALRMNKDLGAGPEFARTQHQLAAMLLRRDSNGDRRHADELLASAIAAFERFGMKGPCDDARKLAANFQPGAIEPSTEPPTDAAAAPRPNIFLLEADYWTIQYRGRCIRLRDCKGMRQLSQLLSRPGEEIPALILARTPRAGAFFSPDTSFALDKPIGDCGSILDDRSISNYKQRIRDLRSDLNEAEERNDLGTAEKVRHELERMMAGLSEGVGLGGRKRSAGSSVERARISVRNCIASALRLIERNDDNLGRHLRKSVNTGTYCCYSPSDRSTWHTCKIDIESKRAKAVVSRADRSAARSTSAT